MQWRIRVLTPVLGILLGALLSAPRDARANSGPTFLEAVGISTAVGTVLGASTLPFYDQPGKHSLNMAIGAGAGAAVGLGILVYSWLTAKPEDSAESLASLNPQSAWSPSRRWHLAALERVSLSRAPSGGSGFPSVQFWMPLASLTW